MKSPHDELQVIASVRRGSACVGDLETGGFDPRVTKNPVPHSCGSVILIVHLLSWPIRRMLRVELGRKLAAFEASHS